MKNKFYLVSARWGPDGFFSCLFRPLTNGLIIILLMLFSAITPAQDTPPTEEFVLDGSMSYEGLFIDPIYNSYLECGFNTMTQRATDASESLLGGFNLNAINMKDSSDWIYYYSSSYYSKWEAEEDKPNNYQVGVKHSAGEIAYWNNGNDSVLCWSTKGITQPVDTLLYGPTYHQEKWYRRWLYEDYDIWDLKYTPRFNMALDIKGNVSPEDTVCRIYVLIKYRRMEGGVAVDSTDSTYVLTDTTYLKVSDFPENGDFGYLYLSNNPTMRYYTYPEMFRNDITYDKMLPLPDVDYREDRWAGQGVQFCIDWLRSDTLCTLYIDNIEVYDNDGWNYYLEEPFITSQNIIEYAQDYSDWTNMKYWMGGHEPASIDCYTPIKTVDAILQSNNFPLLMLTVKMR
ncbi:MAG: hypothetical protein ACHQLA_03860 [Ignavibacteriales bacterium]